MATSARVRTTPFILFLTCAGLCAIGCGRTERYVEQLGHDDGEVRRSAAHKLLLLGESAVPELLQTLETGPERTRYIVAQLLGKIGDRRATEPLISVLESDQAPVIREEAVIALGKLADERALQSLARACEDTEVIVRAAAVRALANIRYDDTNALKVESIGPRPFLRALEDWSPEVRKETLLALVRLQYVRLDSLLLHVIADEDDTVRFIAVQLLGRHGDDAAVVKPLIAALQDSHAAVREQAAMALGQRRAEGAEAELIDLMTRSPGPDGEAARRALKEITGIEYELVD